MTKKKTALTNAEALMSLALNDLYENSGAILNRPHENLQQIPLLIKVHENIQSFNGVEVLLYAQRARSQTHPQVAVVALWYTQKLDAAGAEHLDSMHYIKCSQSYVLHARAVVVIHKLLDLTLAHPLRRLVDRHLDRFIYVCHDY